MKILTVFTPTFNRKHTLVRTYESLRRQTNHDVDWLIVDDGSSDGTMEWVKSLGKLSAVESQVERGVKSRLRFDWMGRIVDGDDDNHFIIESTFCDGQPLRIEYIFKPNGGLYTGYNVAYQTIQTELCVCIDSDDFMPDDAVEKIIKRWKEYYPDGTLTSAVSPLTGREYCGIQGLDFDINTNAPIGGFFPLDLKEIFSHELHLRKIHSGDTKQVMRTELMREVAPMIGFEGEKNFNPVYMLSNVCDKYPILILNENLCTVEYQIGADSMSQGIFRQYINSPRSFAKMRLQEMTLVHNTWNDRFRSAIHYVSSCVIARENQWLSSVSNKGLVIIAAPLGYLLSLYVRMKNANIH